MSLTQILAEKTVFVQALFRIMENTYDADMNPVSHTERWGFVVLMKLPAAPLSGISVSLQKFVGYSGEGK